MSWAVLWQDCLLRTGACSTTMAYINCSELKPVAQLLRGQIRTCICLLYDVRNTICGSPAQRLSHIVNRALSLHI